MKLAKKTLRVENKTVRLTRHGRDGQVKEGKRRVVEYFLGLLIQVTSESLREW